MGIKLPFPHLFGNLTNGIIMFVKMYTISKIQGLFHTEVLSVFQQMELFETGEEENPREDFSVWMHRVQQKATGLWTAACVPYPVT